MSSPASATDRFPPARRLIVNADDFGAAPAVTAGIAEAWAEGIVTATSVLVNLEGFDDCRRVAADCPGLDLGLHWNLSWGPPLSRGTRRLAPRGRLPGKRRVLTALLARRIPEAEISAELDAQYEAFEAAFGPPSHADVHQHLHVAPRAWRATLEVARRRGIPFLRCPREARPRRPLSRLATRAFRPRLAELGRPGTTDAFCGLETTGRLDRSSLAAMLRRTPDGLTELMVHPGRGAAQAEGDRLARTRARELAALTHPETRALIDELGITLTTFAEERRREW